MVTKVANREASPKIAPPWTEYRDRRLDREVYFIRAVALGFIKIGVANFARKRLEEMRGMSPDDLELMGVVMCDRGGVLEKELHEKFSHLRRRNEWFDPGEELLEFIRDHASSPRTRAKLPS